MPYANGRTFLDADSHIMELPDFLRDNADPGIRDRIPRLELDGGDVIRDRLSALDANGGHDSATVEKLVALGDGLISGPKGYDALGAFDAAERATALDLLGFDYQWVFATFSAGHIFHRVNEPDVMAAAATAHNRGMAEFCDADPRLWGVGTTALDDPDAALAELRHIIDLGLRAVWVPHRPAGGRSPGHDDLDPFWALAAESGTTVVLHVGGHPLQLDPAWMNTGREVPTDWLGGGENVRGKDMISLHQAAETFVGTMVLDGVLERHPSLRVGVVELGAAWVPAMVRRLDQIAEIWKRSEPELASLSRKPSEQITAQMGFTPYPFEDVGAMIRDSNADLYLFSSDYPHVEGGRNPLGRFGQSLDGFDDDVLTKFYSGNMARLVSEV